MSIFIRGKERFNLPFCWLSIAVTKYVRSSSTRPPSFKEETFIWAYKFRGFSPQSADYIVWGPVVRDRTPWGEHVVKEARKKKGN